MPRNRIQIVIISLVAASLASSPHQSASQSLQGPQDPGYADLIGACTNPPQARGGARGGRGGGARGGGGAGEIADQEYTVTAIPGVIAAGQRWTLVWEGAGNNADGIIGTEDGALLIAQNDNGAVLRLDADRQVSSIYTDTRTGGALSRSSAGALFIAERALNAAIGQLEPERRTLANRYQGDPLDCIGGVLNDLTADSRGGAYFTMGGLFYAASNGTVTRYGEGLNTNGVILSPEEETLYVTNGDTIAAFDVAQDGSLDNQTQFVELENGGTGDGLTVDAEGRLYVTGQPGIHVISPDGAYLGLIPTPRGVITAAFSGPDKRTLFAVANNRVVARVYSIPMLAEGFAGRAK